MMFWLDLFLVYGLIIYRSLLKRMDTCTCIMHGREIEPSIYGGSHGYGEYINLVFLLYIKDFFEAFISFTVTQWIRC